MRVRRRFATGRRDSSGTSAPRRAPAEWLRGWWRAADRRFTGVAVALFVLALTAGYLFAALWLFPAPIFAESSAIPNLRGLTPADAGERLSQRGFRLVEEGRVQHPDLAPGTVAWQDPPPEVVAPEGTEVHVQVSGGPQRVAVPDVGGYDVQLARTLLEAAGLVVGSVETAPAPTPPDVAVNTRPPAGATLPPGAEVTLVVSVGGATIRVPSLLGRTLEDARRLIDSAGLTVGDYSLRTDPTAEPGTIIEQRPSAGTLAAPGARVQLRIARRENP